MPIWFVQPLFSENFEVDGNLLLTYLGLKKWAIEKLPAKIKFLLEVRDLYIPYTVSQTNIAFFHVTRHIRPLFFKININSM